MLVLNQADQGNKKVAKRGKKQPKYTFLPSKPTNKSTLSRGLIHAPEVVMMKRLK